MIQLTRIPCSAPEVSSHIVLPRDILNSEGVFLDHCPPEDPVILVRVNLHVLQRLMVCLTLKRKSLANQLQPALALASEGC